MSQPLVLAIEPDLRQAAIVKRIVREKALADVAVVDSRDAAIEAMRTRMPDVLLLSALLSPRDEDELIAHLRTLEQRRTTSRPTRFRSSPRRWARARNAASRGLLSAFRRKKDPAPRRRAAIPTCSRKRSASSCSARPTRSASGSSTRLHAAPDMRPSARGRDARGRGDRRRAGPHRAVLVLVVAVRVETVERLGARDAGPGTGPARRRRRSRPADRTDLRAGRPRSDQYPDLSSSERRHRCPRLPVVEPAAPSTQAAPLPAVVVEPSRAAAPVVEPPVHAVAAIPSRRAEPIAARSAVAAKARTGTVPPEGCRRSRRARTRHATPDRRSRDQAEAAKDRESRDRLGAAGALGAHEAPRAAKTAPVTSDDVRALISSLAVPAAVASVDLSARLPHPPRARPGGPDHDGGRRVGPVILSRRTRRAARTAATSMQPRACRHAHCPSLGPR